MRSGLTATMDFGFSAAHLSAALERLASDGLDFRRDAENARALGIGTVQLEALGAWMRYAGLVVRAGRQTQLTPFARLIIQHDPDFHLPLTWWAIHWHLATNYIVWRLLSRLGYRRYSIAELDSELASVAPEQTERTIRNARQALVKALEQTPLGQQLGIVALVFEGDRVTAVEKRPVRYGQAPIAAVAYALAEWAVRENIASAALETLVSVDGPGAVLHMGEGVMERYLMGIHGAFEGEVLSYSRTADLDEAYFKTDVAPLAVLTAGYLAEMESLPLRDAFERAKQEVKSEPAD